MKTPQENIIEVLTNLGFKDVVHIHNDIYEGYTSLISRKRVLFIVHDRIIREYMERSAYFYIENP